MIPLLGTGKVKMMGAMRRVTLNAPVIPEISPDIQGLRAYELLSEEQKGMLMYALCDAAKLHNCRPYELRWAFGKGPKAPLKIWKPETIEL